MISSFHLVYISILALVGICYSLREDTYDNIDGAFVVKFNWHYSNKTTITWGHNSEKYFKVKVSLFETAATYDCKNTTNYSCEDPVYMYDWNKLWGKARCGYSHDHHDDSDRFVFRKCSDNTCKAYVEGENRIQIAAYSYDYSVPPYTGENPELLKEFMTTILPNVYYIYELVMDETGLSTFILRDETGLELEKQTVQHKNLCVENYYEGTVNGLYFGGTCRAPIDILAVYTKA
jgi:hypothetical protein